MPFFWGTDAEGHLVFSDDEEVVKQGCGKSFAPFPKGILLIRLDSIFPYVLDMLKSRALSYYVTHAFESCEFGTKWKLIRDIQVLSTCL